MSRLPPGPRWPRPVQAVLWGLRFPEFTRAARRRYGPTFTVRPGTMPPAVVTSDLDAIRRLFTGDPLARRSWNEPVRPLVGDGSVILMRDPHEHLARRRLLLPPFHGDRVRGFAELMERLMEAEVDRWRPGTTVAVLPSAHEVTIEVMLQAILGVSDPDMRRRFRELLDDILFYPLGALRDRGAGRRAPPFTPPQRMREALAFAVALPTPAVATYLPETKARSRWNAGLWRWWQLRDRLAAWLDEHVAATRSDPRLAERGDVAAVLVRAHDEHGRAISDADVREELLGLVAAGHENTSAAIAWGAVLLAHNPSVRERAAAAAREGDDEYLGALVKEVLRIRPPLPATAGRILLTEPLTIGPHTIPAGTLILIDTWGVQHDPDVHPDPDRFDPERFLSGALPPYSWLPFGGGGHRCIGAPLAELEVKVALRTILCRVALEPADPELPPIARRGISMVPHGGGRVRVA